MKKENAAKLAETTEKYSFALCSLLHPSQTKELYFNLLQFMKNEEIPKIEDSYVRLALYMIVSDLMWQERQERKNNENGRL